MLGYRSRLERDLKRWQEAGIVGADAAGAIRADVAGRSRQFSLAPALAILGAVLLSFAAMTFVAANWQELTRLTRLIILFGALWAAYGGAWGFQRMKMPFFAQAAILLGCGLFGANIMLIAQMYHISGNPPDTVLVWAGGTWLAGVLLRSRPALALAIILVCVWSWWEVKESGGAVHLPFLAAWALAAAPVVWLRWRPGYHLLALALGLWIVGLGYLLSSWDMWGTRAAHPLVVLIGLGIVLAAGLGTDIIDRAIRFSAPAMVYGLAIACAGLFAIQFIERGTSAGAIALLAAITLGLVVSALFYGRHTDNSALARFAYLAFSAELLGLYFKTLGTLLDTALFFLVAGVIVILLAAAAWGLHRSRLLTSEGAS